MGDVLFVWTAVSNRFGARMRTTLAQWLVSIVWSVFDQKCFNRLATHFNISMFGHQTMFDDVWLPNISHLDRHRCRAWIMKLCKPNRISLWANEKIFMNANRMGALKLLTGQSLSSFFCLRFEFMLRLRQNMKFWWPTIFASLRELAPSRNVLNNKSAIVVYTGDLFTGMDFDTISVCVQPRLFMKNVDFSNRQRLKVS